MTQSVIHFFQSFPLPRLAIFTISLMPIFELRLGLIAAAMFGVTAWQAAIICYIGNILPIPIVLLFVKSIIKFLKRFKLTRRPALWVERRANKKSKSFERGAFAALLVFVAIPLPGTGAWTGALIASLLNMPMKRSFATICLGVLCAGIIMMTLTYLLPGIFNLYAGIDK